MDDASTQEEKDHQSFLTIFYPDLQALSLPASEACNEMGNYNTPWEIQDELVSWSYLIDSPTLDLVASVRQELRVLVEGLKLLPRDAIAPDGVSMTNHTNCAAAMRHPAWEPLRQIAAQLVPLLAPIAKRSEAFFYFG